MKLKTLLEMTQTQAVQIFAKHGEDVSRSSPEEIKKARTRLAKRFQADLIRGGDSDLKMINAAYDVLKNGVSDSSSSGRSGGRWDAGDRDGGGSYTRREEPQETPVWAMAGYSGGQKPSASISRENFTDVNYFKKMMWKLSDESREEWTIWGFDGQFFRGVVTVYGNSSIFSYMADAMYTWQTMGVNSYSCRAVFVSQKSSPNKLSLIYADKKYYTGNNGSPAPIEFEHESFNSNPGNDQSFLRGLPAALDDLKNGTK